MSPPRERQAEPATPTRPRTEPSTSPLTRADRVQQGWARRRARLAHERAVMRELMRTHPRPAQTLLLSTET